MAIGLGPLLADDGPPPFLHLRDTTLRYHGPDEDISNQTEYRIGWFGPTDPTNQLGADLWWAANQAIQEHGAGRELGAGSMEQGGRSLERGAWSAEQEAPNCDLRSPISHLPSPLSPLPAPRSKLPAPCSLLPVWSSDPWGSGVAQLARMVYEEQPVALMGSIDSATTHLAEQIVAKANLPLISPIATDKSITLAGVSWMFSCAPSDAAIARALVNAILSALAGEPGRLVLITTTDHESRQTAREVVRELSRRHQPPDYRFDLRPRTADLTEPLASVAEIQPSVVVILADAEDSARITRAIRERLLRLVSSPLNPPGSLNPATTEIAGAISIVATTTQPGDRMCLIFGGQSMARTRFLELVGTAGEGVHFPLPATLNPSHPAAERFVNQFTAARHHPPDYTALLTYDATRLLLEAIRQAGPNRSRIRIALASLSPWEGITGTIQFDGTGQNVRTHIAMATLRDGAVVPFPDAEPSEPIVRLHASP